MNKTQQLMFKNAVSAWAKRFINRKHDIFKHLYQTDKHVLINRNEVVCKEWLFHKEMTDRIQKQLPEKAEAVVIVEKDLETLRDEYGLLVREKKVIHGSIIRTDDNKNFVYYEGVFQNHILNPYSRVFTPPYPISLKSLLQAELEELPEYRLHAVTGSIDFLKGEIK